ncbi:hypothetical protein KAF25_001620 [Fusarium avenaceum]|uniref:GTP-binding protein rho2 n=1 Tax=Fusarium avenaceum TaxID=40199 RepID=A0A9P7GZ36_9HYPO|nr:hypothetical protein KAF25_001620 [Fusarium avenaceum]
MLVPTIFDKYVADCMMDGKSIQLSLWDISDQADYEQLRMVSYSRTHVVLVAFSVDSVDSLESVKAKWMREVHDSCPGAPTILVGLKTDLRENRVLRQEIQSSPLQFVTTQEGKEYARELGAICYVECSALTGQGIDNVFELAVRATLVKSEEKQGKSCCVVC